MFSIDFIITTSKTQTSIKVQPDGACTKIEKDKLMASTAYQVFLPQLELLQHKSKVVKNQLIKLVIIQLFKA